MANLFITRFPEKEIINRIIKDSFIMYFVYLEPDPQHVWDMNPASNFDAGNVRFRCWKCTMSVLTVSFDMPIFVLDLEQSSSSIYRQVLHCFTSMNCLQSKPNDICQSLKKLKPQNRLIQMYLQRYN